MVTDEMVEAGCKANFKWYLGEWITEDQRDIARQQVRTILEAALSAAEPVAWQPRYKQEVIDHLRTVSDNVSEYAMTVFPTKDQAEEYGHGGHQVRPLYVAPALAVVSKELPYHCDVCSVPGYGDAPCSPLCDSSALSAQVQDVAEERTEVCERCQGNGEIVTDWERYRHPHEGDVGDEAVAECPDCDGIGKVSAQDGWKIVPTAPTEDMLCAVDHDDCATPDAAERAYRAMLSAAPAKQEGGR